MDFPSALTRLLQDGNLRDAFAKEPAAVIRQFGLTPEEVQAMLKINPDDLEFQARVLLRKRFQTLGQYLPTTLQMLGDSAWPQFLTHARFSWPDRPEQDAADFCQWLAQQSDLPFSALENNQLQFAIGKRRVALALVARPLTFQLLIRTSRGWREWKFHF